MYVRGGQTALQSTPNNVISIISLYPTWSNTSDNVMVYAKYLSTDGLSGIHSSPINDDEAIGTQLQLDHLSENLDSVYDSLMLSFRDLKDSFSKLTVAQELSAPQNDLSTDKN